MTDQNDPVGSAVAAAIEAYCQDSPVNVEDYLLTTDLGTNEELLDLIASIPSDMEPTDVFDRALDPVLRGYVRAVVDGGFEYPLETLVTARDAETEESITALAAFRIAPEWVRAHERGEYTLSQLRGLVAASGQAPEEFPLESDESEWIPDYHSNWKQREPSTATDESEQVVYDDWAGATVSWSSIEGDE